MVEIWNQPGTEAIGRELARSILIAGIEEEQYFLIIPPKAVNGRWKYWEFASWLPGESPFNTLTEYFNELLGLLEEEDDTAEY